MSDDATNPENGQQQSNPEQPQQDSATEPNQEQQQEQGKTFTQDELDRIVSDRLAREAKKTAELTEKAKRLDELEEANKTEAQKNADALAKAQRAAEDARAESLRYKAAATHHVDPDNFDLLGNGTEEEIAARAERVGGLLAASRELEQVKAELAALKEGKSSPASPRPTPNLQPGATPVEVTVQDDAYPAHWTNQRASSPAP